MKRTVAVLALVALMSLHATPSVWGGGAALTQPVKTSGPAVSATIVMDATPSIGTHREMSIRISKGTTFRGAQFLHELPYTGGCILGGFTIDTSTDIRFIGYMSDWVPQVVLNALFGDMFTMSDNPVTGPVITSIDNPACTQLSSSGPYYLSFTATIQAGSGLHP